MANELKRHKTQIPDEASRTVSESDIRKQMEVSISQMYMGRIPPASEFAKYEEVLPGSADRILKMAEKQSEHRRAMEDRTLAEGIKASRRGQIFGFILALVVVLVGCWLLIMEKNAWGLAAIIAEVVGLVGLFVYNRESEKDELKQKREKTKHD